MKRLSFQWLSPCVLVMLLATTASAQGVLISVGHHHHPLPRPIVRPTPIPQSSYKIKEISVNARVTDQVARVQVSQSFVNTGSRTMEVAFVFPLPYDGAIDQLTLLVDGKEYPAKLMDAKKARTIYEGYIRKNQDPALLEWMGRGMFRTSVFPIPAGAERKVTMRYSQLLRKDHNLTDFLFPLGTAKYTSKPVEKISIHIAIQSSVPIKSVYSPTHLISIKRPSKKNATIAYEAKNTIPSSDFRLLYDISRGKLGASVLSYHPEGNEEGYLLLLASPQIKAKSEKRPRKTVIFVVDRSGSMSGKKIKQAKEALKFVINHLREGDRFNIVAYDSTVESFRPELEKFSDETRKAALGFVEGIYAGGATNIDGALTTALKMLKEQSEPNFILFLTDGLPTAGETNEMKIVASAKKHNKVHARILNFGVGYDVNSRLLDRLSRACFGQSEYVRPNEDSEAHVSRVYNKISSPVMSNVKVRFEFDETKTEEGKVVNRLYPKNVTDLFEGEQLVLVGRYKKGGLAKIIITGQVGSHTQSFSFPAKLVQSSSDETYAFVEKLWAVRRIGEIIDEIDLNGKNKELIKELVSLSTKHGILTPYTSFLADDQAPVSELASARRGSGRSMRLAEANLDSLHKKDGKSGFAQRATKNAMQQANLAAPSAGFGGRAKPSDKPGKHKLARKPGASNRAMYHDMKTGEAVVVETVRNVGQSTLYKRGNVWFAANATDIDLKRDKAKIIDIQRFTPEYFALIRANTTSENAILAQQQTGEELIVRFRSQTYRIK